MADARSEQRLAAGGGSARAPERIQFQVGRITGRYGDSLQPAVKTQVLRLSTAWQQVTITLAGMDLAHVIGGFGWVGSAQDDPRGAIFYLDDIEYSA